MRTEAMFLRVPHGGRRFALFHEPEGAARALALYIHPFAEELNKSRRMAALQARSLAEAGFAVLQLDLLGCGDSSGDFGDASWDAWIEDILFGIGWLRSQADAPLWLWGLRAGCLLAADAARRLDAPCHLLCWQGMASGAIGLKQFLRLKTAAQLLDGKERGAMQALQQRSRAGESIDIAGYTLSSALVTGFERSTQEPSSQVARLEWLEVSTQANADLSPASTACLDRWRRSGTLVSSRVVQGPAFWQTTEIEEAPALLEATHAVLAEVISA